MLNEFESKMMDVIYNCGALTKSGILKLGGTEEAIQQALKSGYFRKFPADIGNNKISIFKSTPKGMQEYEKQYKKTYFAVVKDPAKAVALSYFFIQLVQDGCLGFKNQEEMKAEGEIRNLPSFTYINNGELHALIVVRDIYQNETIERMNDYIVKHGIKKLVVMKKTNS